MKQDINQLKLQCSIAIKEIKKRGLKVKYLPLGKMSRKELTGAWGSLCEQMKEIY
jgi:hypothetical protein